MGIGWAQALKVLFSRGPPLPPAGSPGRRGHHSPATGENAIPFSASALGTPVSSAMAAAARTRVSSFRAGGCFTPEGSRDCSATRRSSASWRFRGQSHRERAETWGELQTSN
ncbi:uncharacterized protein LOC125126353 [Phacochoerus africanus]|uniref:uncharacterized protein LOC125126353 n=1 Tax=Phacochoerus africanus TaxID=41426 RepID=UPI001FD90619|nr:uncharacterized protein LOC125126353 [Phacochoerus africanus]